MADGHHELEPGDHFHVGGAATEYVEVWVLSRSEAADYWGGNELLCEVRLSVGGFRGKFLATFQTTKLETFADEVRTLHKQLDGSARFDSLHKPLQLVLEGDGRGHIRCRGQAQGETGTGNYIIKFDLDLDQTQLFGTMTELAELLNRYPVRGSPAA